MNKSVNDELFDGLLRAAFSEYCMEEMENVPSDEELATRYPQTRRDVRKMERQLRRMKHGKPVAVLYLQRVALAILLLATLSFGLLVSNDKVRADISDAFIHIFEKRITFDYRDCSDEGNITDIYDINVDYFNQNFKIRKFIEDQELRDYIYTNDIGNDIHIVIGYSDSLQMSVSKEYSDYTRMTINGMDVHLLYKGNENAGTIITGNRDVCMSLTACVGKDELIGLFKQIKFEENE